MLSQEMIDGRTVRLRPFRDADVAELAAGANDPVTQRFMAQMPSPYTEADARWWIREGSQAGQRDGSVAYAIADAGTDRLLGGAGIGRVVPERGQAEVGYWVAPWARGRGVATETTTLLADWAFRRGLARLELLTHPENVASQRVAIAAGFRREGVRRDAATDRAGARQDLIAWVRLATDDPGPAPRLLPDLPGGELTDGVVTLRPLGPEYAEFLHELLTVADIVASAVPPVVPSRDDTDLRCRRAHTRWLAGERIDFVIHDTATGAPTGDIGLYYQEPQTKQAMIGYSLLPAWRRRGYTSRAARLVARWAFAHTDIARLIAGTVPENIGSQRVLESVGFRREGLLRARLPGRDGSRIDDIVFGLLPADITPAPPA